MGKDSVEATNGPRTDGRLLRSRATRQALVEAARQVFLDKGYRDATVDDITGLAGCAHGTFYAHFSGKDDILLHALDDLVQALYDIQEQEPFTPSSVAEIWTKDKEQFLAAQRLGVQYRPLLKVLREAIQESTTIRAYWEDTVIERVVRRAEEDERYAQAHGLAKPLDTSIVSRAVVALSTYFMWRFVLGLEPPERVEAVAETLTEIYVRGFYVEERQE